MVVVHFCCYNKPHQAECFANDKDLFLTVLVAEIQVIDWQILSMERLSLLPRWHLIATSSRGMNTVSLHGRKDRQLYKASVKWALIPCKARLEPLFLNHIPKGPLSEYHHEGIKPST